MDITLIGSGNVASHLGRALVKAGHKVLQVWSRNLAHAQSLASLVGGRATDQLRDIAQDSDCYIVAVADDAIASVAEQLRVGDRMVLHTSGSTGKEVLQVSSSRYGVIWSPQTFVKGCAMDYSELPFCVEGSDEQTTTDIEALLAVISKNIYRMDWEQRKWVHLAAVMVNNFANALNATSEELLRRQGVPFEVLLPLIRATAAQAESGCIWQKQTGPAKRGDALVVARQRELLRDDAETLEVYDALTKLIGKHTC